MKKLLHVLGLFISIFLLNSAVADPLPRLPDLIEDAHFSSILTFDDWTSLKASGTYMRQGVSQSGAPAFAYYQAQPAGVHTQWVEVLSERIDEYKWPIGILNAWHEAAGKAVPYSPVALLQKNMHIQLDMVHDDGTANYRMYACLPLGTYKWSSVEKRHCIPNLLKQRQQYEDMGFITVKRM